MEEVLHGKRDLYWIRGEGWGGVLPLGQTKTTAGQVLLY